MTKRDFVGIARKYAEDVVSGAIPACKWVRLACQRQIDDFGRIGSDGFPYHFDERRANHVCWFIERLPHVKGRWKSKNITLEPWQIFGLTTVFGWVDGTGLRRFRKALEIVPRKNAKTTKAAGVGLYMLSQDREPGSEVYSAASTRDQAKICWDIAKRMVRKEQALQDRYGIVPMAHSIVIESEGAFYKPLSRDADSLEGLNPHAAIIDELHAHKTREVFDVLDEATGARLQPLIYIISTEGDDETGVFPQEVRYLQSVLDGSHADDSYWGIIYTIDEEDDPFAPESWAKANPNLGISVFFRDMEDRARRAVANADSQASFLTKRLNVRVGAAHSYFNMLAWKERCYDPTLRIEDFYGEECVITLDLASKRDLTAKLYGFERNGHYCVFGRYYLPESALEQGKPNRDFYLGWEKAGKLIVTPGNITDYAFVERDLLEDQANFVILKAGVDPNYNAGQFSTRMLEAGLPIVDVPHNVLNFSDPMKQLDALMIAGRMRHDGDPVLTWSLSNVTAKRDAKDNVYPRKAHIDNKIDPAVALIANRSLMLRMTREGSIYDSPETAAM